MNEEEGAKFNKFLAVDTASAHLTVVAANGKKAAKRYLADCALKHSVLLMDEVESAMDEAELSPSNCDFFCAVTGPGSFTGIRIGVSAAKGFALAAGRPLMPLTSFELVAYNVNAPDFFAVADAAHAHYYVCRVTGGAFGEPVYISREELVSTGLALYGFQPLGLPRYTQLDAGDCLYPAVCKKLSSGSPFGEMHALYVRKSQAEEGRK